VWNTFRTICVDDSPNDLSAKFVRIEVRTDKENQEPAYYIKEISPISLKTLSDPLVDPDRPAYNGLYNNVPGGDIQTSTNIINNQKQVNSIHENVTPILKIRIQKVYDSGNVEIPTTLFTSTAQLSPGVDIVRYKNIWNQVNDMIGVNIFEPVISKDLNSIFDLSYPGDSRKSQAFVKNSVAPHPTLELQGTPTLHPLYGSFDPSEPHNFAPYRFASFLLDGRSLLEGMKRLDAYLRLLVNRTGDQTLINESSIELKEIIDRGINGSTLTYGSTDFMLKSGKIFHNPANNTGDTYRQAIHFLDNCVKYISNRLGIVEDPNNPNNPITRDQIDGTDPWTSNNWDLTNPPGLDITQNMNFFDAIQALRDHFTSRGNDTVTGRHVYSSDESNRDAVPDGQKSIVNKTGLTVTNDDESNVITKDGEVITSDSALIKVQNENSSKITTVKPYEVKITQGQLEARLDNNVAIVSDYDNQSAAMLHKEGTVELFTNNKSIETAAIENGASVKKVDYVQGLEVASLDHDSRYSVNRLSSHDDTRKSLGQGPVIEGVVNASLNSSYMGALVNQFDINPKWSDDQLKAWAGSDGVSFGSGGTIIIAPNTAFYPGSFHVCRGELVYVSFELVYLNGLNNGNFYAGIMYYNSSFAFSTGESFINKTTNTTSFGTSVISNPNAMPYYKHYLRNTGNTPVTVIYRVSNSYSRNKIFVGQNNYHEDPGETLIRKDWLEYYVPGYVAGYVNPRIRPQYFGFITNTGRWGSNAFTAPAANQLRASQDIELVRIVATGNWGQNTPGVVRIHRIRNSVNQVLGSEILYNRDTTHGDLCLTVIAYNDVLVGDIFYCLVITDGDIKQQSIDICSF
jgi:hypothetical protein